MVSKARAERGKVSKMRALAVQEKLRGRGLAAKAIRRLQGELGWVAGSKYKLVVDHDLAACMKKEGVGSYARQDWASVGGISGWYSGASVCPGSQSKGSKRQLRVKVECEGGWRSGGWGRGGGEAATTEGKAGLGEERGAAGESCTGGSCRRTSWCRVTTGGAGSGGRS